MNNVYVKKEYADRTGILWFKDDLLDRVKSEYELLFENDGLVGRTRNVKNDKNCI